MSAVAGIGRPLAELSKSMANVEIRHIPYKSVIAGLLDVASGKVSMMFVNLAHPPWAPR